LGFEELFPSPPLDDDPAGDAGVFDGVAGLVDEPSPDDLSPPELDSEPDPESELELEPSDPAAGAVGLSDAEPLDLVLARLSVL
jgi:hypothetical protein